MDFRIALTVLSFLSAAAGAYLGAYLTQKGKNLATREDLAQITRTTAEIKAQISNDLWDRQRRWDTKRELLFDVVKALGASTKLLTSMLAVFRVTAEKGFEKIERERRRAEARMEWMVADNALEDAVVLASVVCRAELYRSLLEVSRDIRVTALDVMNGGDPQPSALTLLAKQHQIIAAVRLELGLG